MSESKTPEPPAGYPEGYPPPEYPTQAPEPQYVKVPAVTREKGGSEGCMGGFLKGFRDGLCCLFKCQYQNQCCPCGCCCCGCT